MLKAPLEDSTAVRMRREVVHVSTEGTDKRQTIGGDALDQLLVGDDGADCCAAVAGASAASANTSASGGRGSVKPRLDVVIIVRCCCFHALLSNAPPQNDDVGVRSGNVDRETPLATDEFCFAAKSPAMTTTATAALPSRTADGSWTYIHGQPISLGGPPMAPPAATPPLEPPHLHSKPPRCCHLDHGLAWWFGHSYGFVFVHVGVPGVGVVEYVSIVLGKASDLYTLSLRKGG